MRSRCSHRWAWRRVFCSGSSPQDANAYVTIPVLTGMSYVRNVIFVKTGRVVIAVGGTFGTLPEIAHALGDGMPAVGFGTWELSHGVA
jgi:uncharacterized protein (TIGR00725 family)